MLTNTRITSTLDRERLAAALDRARNSWTTYAPNLDLFRTQFRRYEARGPADVPGDVITMNSRFTLRDAHTGEAVDYELVYPEDEAPGRGKLSVLSPLGIAVLGARVGDDVFWDSADAPEVARIERLIYQPEADGLADR